MLRKWFLSQVKIAAPESVVEAWAGHAGYLDDAYRRYSKDQMREFYEKAELYLLIGVPRVIAEIQTKFQKDLEELRQQNLDLYKKLTDITVQNLQLLNENRQLKERLDKAEQKLSELEKLTQQLM